MVESRSKFPGEVDDRSGQQIGQAYEAIESMIILNELAPGRLISESMLMDLTGFGRTPVREALQRLDREAMVEIHPKRGVLVAPTCLWSRTPSARGSTEP